jgi:ABC-type transport system involved in multi-copper enzyme maturation permease subunit
MTAATLDAVRTDSPLRRAARVGGLEFSFHARRPLLLVLVLLIGLTTWGLTTGTVRIDTGDQTVGGKRAYITSEHSNALTLCIVTFLYYTFFVAVASGMSVPRDDELKVGEVLHTTGLRPREYVWGKFAGILASFLAVLVVHLLLSIVIYHWLPYENSDKIRGPFAWGNYVGPALVLAVPQIVFMAGLTFLLGERTRRPILVFLLPVALMLVAGFFLWTWSPPWLDVRVNRLLMWIEPAGYRWLNETLLEIDRGVDYYNTQPVAYDAGFLLSRAALVVAGLAAVGWSERHFARGLRGARRLGRREQAALATARDAAGAAGGIDADNEARPLAALDMRPVAHGFLGQAWTIARFELRNLASSPGLYLFIPLILTQAIQQGYYATGSWGTRLLVTPGTYAALSFNTLTLTVVLLLLFYTAESFDRERSTGLYPIWASTPLRTGAMLCGKAVANCVVAVVVLLAAWLACAVILVAQGKVGMDLRPFLIVWGLLLVPTFLLWSSFVMALMAVTGNRYATYALAVAVLVVTGLLQARDKMTWVWNWDLWSTVRWSDMGLLEPNGWPLVLNRVLAVLGSVLFIAITVQVLARREHDATRTLHRLAPERVLRRSLRLLPYALPMAIVAIWLGALVWNGFQSKAARKRDRDYWKQNLATWKDAPLPAIAHLDLDVTLQPARHSLRSTGTYTLVNIDPEPLRQIALTLATHIRDPKWKMAGQDYAPDRRANLFVFTPAAALAHGDSLAVGFDYETRWPDGITRNGGGMREFIQPSGVVLTGFSPILAPVVGYLETIGVDPKENEYEPRVYPDDFYKGLVQAGFNVRVPFTTRIRLHGPAEYTYNSVGVLVEDRVEGDQRHVEWVSDHPVALFNVVAGKWAVRRGENTAIYHHPGHTYNIEEIGQALDAARRWYSEWFYPYPWRELKLSQFADLASYAQGFATDITFSESIGFLALSDPRARTAFTVTAHEAAHQWWGNLLTPGEGPGGDILSEGMAHFSTLLLHEQVNGLHGRIEFAKRIEERYGERRNVDAERPLVKIDGSKTGDQTVIYDKGGWVFWMLQNVMGRDNNLAGLQRFIRNHLTNPDHALLEDFVDELRPFAPDTTAYDAFARQWFFSVVVPEYQFENVMRVQEGERWIVTGTVTNAGQGTMPVEIAATTAGERFEKQSPDAAKQGPAPVAADYREARTELTLAAGQAAEFRLDCPFEPALVVADPDAKVLQLRRKYAVFRIARDRRS